MCPPGHRIGRAQLKNSALWESSEKMNVMISVIVVLPIDPPRNCIQICCGPSIFMLLYAVDHITTRSRFRQGFTGTSLKSAHRNHLQERQTQLQRHDRPSTGGALGRHQATPPTHARSSATNCADRPANNPHECVPRERNSNRAGIPSSSRRAASRWVQASTAASMTPPTTI